MFGARSGIGNPRNIVLNPELSAELPRASIGSEKGRSQLTKSLRTLATGAVAKLPRRAVSLLPIH
jgi:hypothetical protein